MSVGGLCKEFFKVYLFVLSCFAAMFFSKGKGKVCHTQLVVVELVPWNNVMTFPGSVQPSPGVHVSGSVETACLVQFSSIGAFV